MNMQRIQTPRPFGQSSMGFELGLIANHQILSPFWEIR
jgi:hypothetical protein